MIVAYGCSFTFGDELDDLPEWYNDLTDKRNFMPEKLKYHKPSKKSYPYVMGKILNYEVENYGWRGGSNDRIFRTFFEHILNNTKESIYVIQWTFPHRTEVWSNKIQYYEGIVPTITDWHEASNLYYRNHYDANDTIKKLIRYIWSVDSLSKQFQQKIIQFIPIGIEDLGWDGVSMEYDFKLLDNLPDSFLDTQQIRNLVNYKIHPSEEGHELLGKYLVEKIKQKFFYLKNNI
jgi:hypothetical protein